MHTPLDTGTHTHITSVWAPGGMTSISRVDLSRSGRSSGSGSSAGSMEVEESQDRDAGGGKGGENVSIPIPMGGKMEKRGVEYKCESCNKVGWFEITLNGLWDFFGFFFVSIFCFFFPFNNPIYR